jgi:hypothetical protein
VLTGFAASRVSTTSISSDYTFNQPWSVSSPYYNDGGLNTATGVYTVPTTGVYDIEATIPYSTYTQMALGSSMPGFAVARNGTNVLWSDMPIYGSIATRFTNTDGTVTIVGQLKLTAGDAMTLKYVANGNTSSYDFGPSAARPVVWSIRQTL